MKDSRFDLTLFGEGEGTGEGDGCAAEQQLSAPRNGDYAADAIAKADGTEKTENTLADTEDGEPISAIRRIAFLLGLRGKDEESVIEELKDRRAKNLLFEKLKSRRAQKAYAQIMSEAEALSEKQKGFDLRKEISDRRFATLLYAGFSVEEAWRAVHVEELIGKAREEAERGAVAAAMESIRLSMERPYENGGVGASPASSQQSVESLSGRGIRDILRRVENGAKIKF